MSFAHSTPMVAAMMGKTSPNIAVTAIGMNFSRKRGAAAVVSAALMVPSQRNRSTGGILQFQRVVSRSFVLLQWRIDLLRLRKMVS
jgi:hypothetical protein